VKHGWWNTQARNAKDRAPLLSHSVGVSTAGW
jgi:hypothetical protein